MDLLVICLRKCLRKGVLKLSMFHDIMLKAHEEWLFECFDFAVLFE